MKDPLRVCLVDDHAVVRAGYRRLIELEADLVVAAEHADAESAYAALARDDAAPIDIVVLDLSLPGQSGLELLRHLAQRRPGLRMLVFTMHDAPATVRQCLAAGAAGFVTKSSAPEMLIDALRRLGRGERALSPDIAASADDEPTAPHMSLSVREFDILQRLAAGDGLDRISRTLHLSPKTVANYQAEIRRKLGVDNAIALMQYARRHGLVPA